MASLNIAGHGCGIRYKYGFFEQKIVDCQQVEASDNWLREGNVWEIKKQDKAEIVKFGGSIISDYVNGKLTFTHVNYEPVLAVPYDTPIVGYENEAVNTLRLWSAEPVSNEFDFSSFSRGEFLKAISYKNSVEAISLVLYPEDSFYEGKMLRLKQQYFFVSAGIQSIVRHYKKHNGDINLLDEKIAIHINDTHPTLAIPELMRILLDEEGLSWETAWRITQNTISYTNHTILAEALEKWPIDMFKGLLPRIYMIIEEINRRYCEELWNKYLGQWDKISRMSIIGDGYVRMANLAIVGSHSVNGVAKLHTEILKKREMSDFYYLYPSKFNNKTNGITHRRWLIRSNPKLTNLLIDTIGDSFIKHPTDLENFKNHLDDSGVLQKLAQIKKDNKERLAKEIYKTNGIIIDTNSIFDVQIKRIHAYKRQTLNCLRIMDLYNKLIENPNLDICGSHILEFEGNIKNIVSKRNVPIDNKQIEKYQKRRDAFNHMTVMYKKKAVLKAGNYQSCLLMEDTLLWVNMIQSGAVCSNIDDYLVYARVGKDMYDRRGGWAYLKKYRIGRKRVFKTGYISNYDYLYTIVVQVIVSLIPRKLREFIFKTILHN